MTTALKTTAKAVRATGTAAVIVHLEAEAKRLRQEAAIISDNIATMTGTQCHIGETRGWDDPVIEQIEADIQSARSTRAGCIGEARGLCIAAKLLRAGLTAA